MLFLAFRVFATATAIELLKSGPDQKCIVKDNCFRTPNYPNPYVATDCYAEVISASRVLVWSKHFHMFSSNDGRESRRDHLEIEFKNSTRPQLFFANRGPEKIVISRGDRSIRASTIPLC